MMLTEYAEFGVAWLYGGLSRVGRAVGLSLLFLVVSPFALVGYVVRRAGWEPTGRAKCSIEGHDWKNDRNWKRVCDRCGKQMF